MTGKYIECEYCGNVQRTSISKTHSQFRKFLSKIGWIYIKNAKGVEWDFCSESCYKKFKQHVY